MGLEIVIVTEDTGRIWLRDSTTERYWGGLEDYANWSFVSSVF
ncbi:MAG: hypothetical protein QIT35_gp58 [Methanophagales virus PBV299]|uniref:Uncharacterized protein n=1 Tax=Methanophagales virus PBV299 TaxID=2987730 RepID=A0ABY6GLG6_9CAUD|nr:MAG: hypothetical protein QIT35_gp58 [Methanophagales virus PBV299]UYL64854.1 MAG: hypothetical protein OFDIEDLO_00058 [Methanophagales virus PBV299]